MKPRMLVFSYIDWLTVSGVIISSVFLFIYPLWNYNNQAVLYMVQKKYEKAELKWRQALSENSLFPFYRMNLALNYMLWEQPKKAIQEYEVTRNLVEKMNNLNKEEVLFYSFFNSALAAIQKGKRKQALDFYQQALVPRPESLEVKTNIELLIRENESSSNQDEKKEDSQDEEQKEKGNNESGESQNDQEDNKDSMNQDKDEQNQEEGEQDQKTGEENKEKEENSSSHGDNQEQENKSESDSSQSQDSEEFGKENLNKTQTEAILKAILEQEKKIRERRQRGQQKKPVVEKDW